MNAQHPLYLSVPLAWVKSLERWEAQMRAAGFSERTCDTRTRHVRQLARDIGVAPSEITADHILTYVSGRAWMPETRHAYYTSFRKFFNFFYGDSPGNPASVLPTVRRPLALPRPIPEDLLHQGLVSADERCRLILTLAAVLGLRSIEIAQVHIDHIENDLMGYTLLVKGKGGRERRLPMPDYLARELLMRCSKNPGGWAFPGNVGGHLSTRWVGKLAATVLPERWTLHTLRHRFATRAYAAERDLLILQRLLGHASVATTQRYAEPPADSLRRAIDAAALLPTP